MSDTINLSVLLGLKADRYAKNQGDFILDCDEYESLGMGQDVWNFLVSLGGLEFRVLYLCPKDCSRRDWIGRQGVYKSEQDGIVQGTGHAMRDAEALNIAFNTNVYGGKKVNTGAGKGNRTVKATRVIGIKANGKQYITQLGHEMIELAQSL